jgi:hypothetical protein
MPPRSTATSGSTASSENGARALPRPVWPWEGASNPCNDARVDGAQRGQLREWGAALVASGDGERRSSGRAILMLLDRIDELEGELAGQKERGPAAAPPRSRPPDPEPDDPALSLEDTQPIGLRDRLKLATGYRRHDH